jgi:hypothetical protein
MYDSWAYFRGPYGDLLGAPSEMLSDCAFARTASSDLPSFMPITLAGVLDANRLRHITSSLLHGLPEFFVELAILVSSIYLK